MFLIIQKDDNLIIDAVDSYQAHHCALEVVKNGREYKYISCLTTFDIIEIDEVNLPGDFMGRKYFYYDSIFVLNTDY
jgi:hypothetical protein